MTALAVALVAALTIGSVALAQTPPATTPGAGQTPKAAHPPGANPAPGKDGTRGAPGVGPGADLYDGTGDGSLIAIVASKTGLTTDAVVAAVKGGKTLAQVASEHNVTVETVVNTFVDAQTKALAAKVTAGTITQAQADAAVAQIRTHATEEMNEQGFGPQGGHGGGKGGPEVGPGVDLYDGTGAGSLVAIVADKTGLTTDAVVAAVKGGKTLAQVASDHNVTVDTVVNTFVDAQTKALAAKVTAGTITQAQADAAVAQIRTHATEEMNEQGFGPQGGHGPGGMRGPGAGGAGSRGHGNGGASRWQGQPAANSSSNF